MTREKFWNGIGVFEDREVLLRSAQALDVESEYASICDSFFGGDNEAIKTLAELARRIGVNEYTADYIMLTDCSIRAYPEYLKQGYSSEQFFENMKDAKYKFDECKTVHGVPGTFVVWWNHGWFEVKRFKLGRFQYEKAEFACDTVTISGVTTEKGQRVYNFHIPSSGEDMSAPARIESYKKAYEFYRDELQDGILRLVCKSWLLWPEFNNILGEKSSIRSFVSDFTILNSAEYETYGDYWRVFGKDYTLPPKDLPRDNSLKRGIAEVLDSGKNIGWGYGLILFDGEKIIR